ncbi:hypothetical protein HD554DRAFT_931445 [Boletus coccyginus]|nr:hypothetical protein HD554DRAFT_931445 [Boletus coccyginus]
MFSSAFVALALAASALANVFLTSPVASTTFTAGQQATLSWQDSGEAPSLAQFGKATFAIYVGNAIQQTPLQTIATSVNVSSTSSLTFTPQPDIGPNSDEYFIRVTSEVYKNPSSPQYFAEAFSAKFTLAGMTGSFNATLQAQIDGQSTAPIGATSTASSPSATGGSTATGASASVSSTSKAASTASKAASTASAATSTATTSANGAGKPAITTGFVALVAALIGASLL